MNRLIRWQYIAVIALLILINAEATSQTFQGGADTVLKLTPGEGNSHGQNLPYFPKNVFGLPSTFGNDFAAETREEEICSLNFGGEIIIGFKNEVLIDKEGPDFTIFENAFKSPIPPYIFAEPAKVAVSRDGITFKEFPFDSLTLKGCAGMTQTNGKKNPLDPSESGGDLFDLADIGIDSVRFIKITDLTNLLKPGHPFYQATLTGFDLDAVVGLHLVSLQNEKSRQEIRIYQQNSILTIETNHTLLKEATCSVYNMSGREQFNGRLIQGKIHLNERLLQTGAFIAVLKENNKTLTRKFIIQ
ncbi:MAG: T9SS type A sorting domain-containing protein [Bacteroidota bacterium]